MDYTLLYRVAKAYFVDQRTQQEIADIENFSRSQISRIIKKALEENLVSYKLNFPTDVDEDTLSEQLRQALGLERVHLVPSFYGQNASISQDEISKNLALGAADKLADLLGDAKNVGLGWGRTMYNASLFVQPPQKPIRGRTFIPLIGLSGDNTPALQINTIVDRFGERFRAERHYVNMPSLQPMKPLGIGQEDAFRTLLDRWNHLDAAIISIGGPPAGNKNLISEYPRVYKKQLQASESVGDILAQFYFEDGRILEPDGNFRLLSLDIRQLKQVKNVIALAAGPEKLPAIRIAAKMGYLKTLVTDYDTGIKLLNYKGDHLL
jgi:DNA-binding transcriptional regulator LsrR (DeoR family)